MATRAPAAVTVSYDDERATATQKSSLNDDCSSSERARINGLPRERCVQTAAAAAAAMHEVITRNAD